jgi:hypothetical protein
VGRRQGGKEGRRERRRLKEGRARRGEGGRAGRGEGDSPYIFSSGPGRRRRDTSGTLQTCHYTPHALVSSVTGSYAGKLIILNPGNFFGKIIKLGEGMERS